MALVFLLRAAVLDGRAGGALLFLDDGVAGAGGAFVGVRNGGRGWGDILGHHVFLEALAVLLGAALELAAFLDDPLRGTGAAISLASFRCVLPACAILLYVLIRIERGVLLALAAGAGIPVRFKLGQAGTDTGEGRGLHQLGVGGGARALFDGGEPQGLLLLLFEVHGLAVRLLARALGDADAFPQQAYLLGLCPRHIAQARYLRGQRGHQLLHDGLHPGSRRDRGRGRLRAGR